MEALQESSIDNGVTSSIVDSSGVEHKADLIVAADGMNSTVRSLLFPNEEFLSRRGYVVYRGISRNVPFSDSDYHQGKFKAFQTWGPGARFAVVPLDNKNSVAWYLAITSESRSTSEEELLGPFSNGCTYPVGVDEWQAQQSKLREWHNPINAIIANTQMGEDSQPLISKCDAFSSKRVIKKGLCRGNIAFIGDAAHTLDPILAQGAGVAMEDAQRLADCIREMDGIESLPSALQLYEKKCYLRRGKLQILSDVAQSVGHIDSPSTAKWRDAALRSLPDSMKTYLFSSLLKYLVS